MQLLRSNEIAQAKIIELKCTQCDYSAPYKKLISSCPICGSSILKPQYDLQALKQSDWKNQLLYRDCTLWRYHELLPLSNLQNVVSFGEGFTPLIHAEKLGQKIKLDRLYLKDERQGPTSSFKDRQASVAVSMMREQGITEAVLSSTGNVGIAYSAFAARAGIKLWVFVPNLTPEEKIREMKICGSTVVRINGTYDEAKLAAAEFANREGLFLDGGVKYIAGTESMKTMAFELAEQLNWQSPDWFVQAVSGGAGPIGVAQGFEELVALGLVEKIPALGLIQSSGCAPMVTAFRKQQPIAIPLTEPTTSIATLSTGDPGRAYEVLYRTIEQHGGILEEASDEEAYAATRLLAQTEGISVEPGTAVAFAGLIRLVQKGIIQSHETVAINCSGHTYPVETKILNGKSPA